MAWRSMTRAEIDANYAKVSREAVGEAREELTRYAPTSEDAERMRENLAWFSRSEAYYGDGS